MRHLAFLKRALWPVLFFLLITGCDDSEPALPPPSAEFDVSERDIRIWDVVQFRVASENGEVDTEWHFEGGSPEHSDDTEPEVLYKTPGEYGVTLTVRNEAGETTIEQQRYIVVSEYENQFGSMTDSRDDQTYKVTIIAGQSIMAQNLNYDDGKAVHYDNDPEHGDVYGRFYTWEMAMDACPPDWRLPTRSEYTMIREYLGGEYAAGGKMKLPGTDHWEEPNEWATNSTGFSAPGSGMYMPGHLEFTSLGKSATYWTMTETEYDNAWTMVLMSRNGRMAIQNTSDKNLWFSVRCVKD